MRHITLDIMINLDVVFNVLYVLLLVSSRCSSTRCSTTSTRCSTTNARCSTTSIKIDVLVLYVDDGIPCYIMLQV